MRRLLIFKKFLIISPVLLILLTGIVRAEEIDMTDAPNVPPRISRIMPEIVVIKFDAKEFIGPLGDGKDY